MGNIKNDRLRIAKLKADRVAEAEYEQWLETRKPITPNERFDLSKIDGWRLSLLEFEAIVDPELKARQLEPENYPPHLQAEFSSLIAPRLNQKYIRRVTTKEEIAA
ncbi:MAG TPA: hypothetical protein VGQ49_00595 [Bryobacteraceae bacterium]|jgi:hypothetical protein|nr:hypothetical protein [Bryobacteraceae bacterium]